MTKEDAIHILTAMKKSYLSLGIPDPEAVEALETAIKAVKAEPCEDSISRHSDYPIKSIEGEEIIERLENIAKHAIHEIGENPFILSLDDGIAVHKAIEIIKAEPYEDAISRQAVLDLAKKGVLVSNDSYKSVSRFIYDLPSVNHVKINDIYPLTIIRDRYNDVYSGGKYLAFNLDADEIPTEIWGDDVECREFFYKVEQGRNDILIGKGHTIEEAVINLQEKMNE